MQAVDPVPTAAATATIFSPSQLNSTIIDGIGLKDILQIVDKSVYRSIIFLRFFSCPRSLLLNAVLRSLS